ncbi:hypothetical protein BSKO_01340 [Bryopsis sp. KO-2023]|nr:hypothetical protein BSKO_01340 [Bryopsis sp. KO-2023]
MAFRVFENPQVDQDYDTYFLRNVWTADKLSFAVAGVTLAVWSVRLSSERYSGKDTFDGVSSYLLSYLLVGAIFALRRLRGHHGPPPWRSVAIGLTRITIALCTAKASGSMAWRYDLPNHPVWAIVKAVWAGSGVPQMMIMPLSTWLKFRDHLITQTAVAAILIGSMEPFCANAVKSPGAPHLSGCWQKLENAANRISLSIYGRNRSSSVMNPMQTCMHVSVFLTVFFGWGLSSYCAWVLEENCKRRFLQHRMGRNRCGVISSPRGSLLVNLVYCTSISVFAFFICWEFVEYFCST